MKYLLFLILVSCAVTEFLFGPYEQKKYCSAKSLEHYSEGVRNYKRARRSVHTSLKDFFYDKEEVFNNCFKKHTVSKVKSRYYCVVIKLRKRETFNRLRYMSVDNNFEGISQELKNCLEKEVSKIEKIKLGLFIDLTFHHALKLER